MTKKKVMLITGTSRGIGRALSQYYVKHGYKVIGCSRAKRVSNANYEHWSMSVSDESRIKELFDVIRKKYKRLDVLINNAGIATMNHFLLTSYASTRKIFETNVYGTMLMCREASKIMKAHQNGRIVNFSSVALPFQLEGEAIYASSKAAIVGLTNVIARELAPLGITVNNVGPNPVATDLINAVPREKMNRLINRQAIKRFGTMKDIINVIDFLIKKDSQLITGQTIYLGGV